MAKDFRAVDRDQQFLLPPDMREWLGQEHLVWFVLSVVEELDVSAFGREAKLGRAGRAPFDPKMLLALLIYAYAHGQRSSRQIERLCHVDVAFRVICANEPPDHCVIARFRQRNEAGIAGLFTQVLALCARAGLGRVGVVAIDGTKIEADAAVSASRTGDRLRAEVEAMLREAEQVDAAEDEAFGAARGDELPPEWSDPATRAGRIRAALERLAGEEEAETARAQQAVECWSQRLAAAQADLIETQRVVAERCVAHAAAVAAGRPRRGPAPVPPERHVRVRQARAKVARNTARWEKAAAKAAETAAGAGRRKANVTDPDSGPMPTRRGWVQGYNAQLAVTDDQIILAAHLTQRPVDVESFIPMMAAATAAAAVLDDARGHREPIGIVLADAGYLSVANMTAPGPDRLIALGKSWDQEKAARQKPASGTAPPGTGPMAAMSHRLRTPEGIAAYRRRGVTVEPVNAHLKDRIGLRRFARRGLAAAQSELALAAAVANLMKIHRATPAPA